MPDAWIDLPKLRNKLAEFFEADKKEFSLFGSSVNQVFEAYVFAQVITNYKKRTGWTIELVHPDSQNGQGTSSLRLKFSTRGRPGNYSYVRCISPEGAVFQIRHQLRVATKHHKNGGAPPANICLDVAVIHDCCLESFSSVDYLPNNALVTFGEAKHMSGFAELIAGFIGLVHEMQPRRLQRLRIHTFKATDHPAPFLFLSGCLWQTAEGVCATIQARKMDVDVYTKDNPLCANSTLPL